MSKYIWIYLFGLVIVLSGCGKKEKVPLDAKPRILCGVCGTWIEVEAPADRFIEEYVKGIDPNWDSFFEEHGPCKLSNSKSSASVWILKRPEDDGYSDLKEDRRYKVNLQQDSPAEAGQ